MKQAAAGDRVGICVSGFDSSTIERTIAAAPGYISASVRAGLISLEKIPFFKKPIQSKKK